ncbi:MAG: MFS transporter, partial [Thermoleophilia bacterium]
MSVSSRSLLPVYLAHSLVHLYLMLFPAVLFIVKHQFGQSYAILGAVYMGATMVYGFGALPVAYWVTRTNPLVLIRVGTLAAALACFGIATAPNAAILAVGLLVLGAAASVHHTAAFTYIAHVSENDARLFGHWGAWGNIGLTISPAFAGLLGWLVSWRLPFAAAGVLGLIISAVLWRRGTSPSAAPARTEAPRDVAPVTTNLTALAWLFGISMAMGFIYTGFTTYLPAYTGVRASFLPTADVVRGGLVASLVYGVGFFGQWWGGHIGARPHLPRRYTFIIAGNAVLLAGIFASASWLLMAMLIVFSFLHFSTQPLEKHRHRQIHGAAL